MKKVLQLISLLLLLTLFSLTEFREVAASQSKSAIQTSFVAVTDSATNWQLKLTDDKKLNRFNYYWSQKQRLQSQNNQAYQWRYQLLIQDNNKTNRWVYDPRGYAREVTLNQATQIYQFSTVRAFNRFLKSLSDKGKQ